MFVNFYNLKSVPFEKSIKKDNLFLSDSLKEFFSRMEYMKHTKGLLLLTGDAGVGKTTAIRAFLEDLKQDYFKFVYIPLTTVSTTDFYHQLNRSLGGENKRSKSELFSSIQKTIIEYATIKKQIPVIIFDEIHFLKNDNLFELQILLNFNFDSLDPAIVILAGHPLMRERIIRPSLNSINQRFRLKYELLPLNKNETTAYILHQLNIAGASNNIFNENAIDAIFNISNGILRVINNIATKALILGTSKKVDTITEEHIFSVSSEL
mgnify:CR=1 FL=1